MKEQINKTRLLQEGYIFSCVDMVKEDNKLWFSAREINGLFSMGMDGKNLMYHGSFPNELESQIYLHGASILYGGKIIFIPYNAKQIDVYDISKKEFQELLPEKDNCFSGYMSTVLYKSNLILLPAESSNSAIVKIDLERKNIKYLENWKKEFELDDQKGMLFREYCIVNERIYAPVVSACGQIMEYDLETDRISCIRVGDKHRYRAICHDGNDFYLCSQKGNVLVRWNKESGVKQQYIIDKQENIMIMSCIYKNGHVFLFTINERDSALSSMVICFEIGSGKVYKIIQTNKDYEISSILGKELSSIYAVAEEEQKLFILNSRNGSLYELDTISLQIREHEIEKTNARRIYQEKFRKRRNNIYIENKIAMQELSLLLETKENEVNDNTQLSIGHKIWNTVKL